MGRALSPLLRLMIALAICGLPAKSGHPARCTHSRTPPQVLVAGGAGYIGSHFVRELAASRQQQPDAAVEPAVPAGGKYEIIVYDNLSTGGCWCRCWRGRWAGDRRIVAY